MTQATTRASLADVLDAVLDADLVDLDRETLVAAAARACFDTVVCMATGLEELLRAAPRELPTGPVPLAGRPARVDALTALQLSAVASQLDDLDDVHWPSVTHPGSVLWPALLTVGYVDGRRFEELARAAAVGYQLIARIALLLGPEHRRTYHATATAGAIATAGAVVHAAGGDRTDAATAMHHAASMAGGSARAAQERARTLAVHRAGAALVGITAAGFARLAPAVADVLGAETPLGGAVGVRDIGDELGRPLPPALGSVTRRSHRVAGFAHTIVDAILDAGLPADATVEHIDVQVPSFVVASMSSVGAPPVDPAWDLPGVVAQAALMTTEPHGLGGSLSPAARRLRERVRVHVREATPPDLASEARITLSSGARIDARRDVPDGHPDRPFSDTELVQKAVRLGAADGPTAARLLEELHRGGELPVGLLLPPPPCQRNDGGTR